MGYYNRNEIELALVLAAPDDAALREDLAQAFRAALREICGAMLSAPASRHAGLVHRLRGLAASFGAASMLRLADGMTAGGVGPSISALEQILREIGAPDDDPPTTGRQGR